MLVPANGSRTVTVEFEHIPIPDIFASGSVRSPRLAVTTTHALVTKDGTPIDGGTWSDRSPWYCGVFKEGTTYRPADVVTYSGSLWFAKEETTAVPGRLDPASRAWVMMVRRGDEGKPGKPGPPGKDGTDGTPGRDLTHPRWP